MKKIIFINILILVSVNNLFAMGNNEAAPENKNIEITQLNPAAQQDNPAVVQNDSSLNNNMPAPPQTRAEQVMRALAEAYPTQIDRVEYRNGDWAVLLRGVWYHYAGGRLLPENLLPRADTYNSHGFYNYTVGLPVWTAPSAEEQERFRNMANNRNRTAIRRSPHFFDSLWRAGNRNEAYDRVKTMRFLGHSVTVHFMIMENLALVEETILAAARTDAQVQAWINTIKELAGWQWRSIADTESRSNHAYGIAIDIIPNSYAGREVYWLWTQRYRADWWNIPYSSRWQPPAAVINAFEKYGFIWGGKWLFFDNMHFEYRPEILILSGNPPETRR